jgi:hypothetical protein
MSEKPSTASSLLNRDFGPLGAGAHDLCDASLNPIISYQTGCVRTGRLFAPVMSI